MVSRCWSPKITLKNILKMWPKTIKNGLEMVEIILKFQTHFMFTFK